MGFFSFQEIMMITVCGNDFERKRDWAAWTVAINWRIRQRLPRVTKFAFEKGLIMNGRDDYEVKNYV
jgi:hypothetical protein